MGYEIEGTIKVIMDVMTFGSGFTKREFVITSGDDKYPQDIKMEFVKDKVALLDRFRPGQRVKVGFEIRGNENNGRYYVSLSAWRINPADGSDGGGDAPMERPREFSGPPRSAGGGYAGGGAGRPPAGGGAPDRRSGGGGFDRERGGPKGGGRPAGRDFEEGGGRRGGKYEEDDVDF
jgi:single-strand DNA-binding protein